MPKIGKASSPCSANATSGLPVLPLLSLEQTAEILVTSTRTVQRLIKAGKLPAFKDRGLVRIRPDDLMAYIDANTS